MKYSSHAWCMANTQQTGIVEIIIPDILDTRRPIGQE